MIVDTSAVIAILFEESEAERYHQAIAQAPYRRMSVANFLEAAMVLEGRSGLAGGRILDAYLQESRIVLEPVTVELAHTARQAWRRFGRGNHPAALNYGDCFAYALAVVRQEPLLSKGGDFALTDVEVA